MARRSLIAALLAIVCSTAAHASQSTEVLVAVRIQGNVATPDDEILRLAGVEIGMPLAADTTAIARERLLAAKRFEQVTVVKRFASISDPTQIVLVFIIDEGPVVIEDTTDGDRRPRVVRSRRLNVMFLPIFGGEDGYGLTYGVRVARPEPLGRDSRLSVPATWGGEKRIAAEFEKRLARGPFTRVESGVAIATRTNPFFDADDSRRSVWVRGERQVLEPVRVSASAAWQHVSFMDAADRVVDLGVELVVDTRLDPWLARNAVYASAAWNRYAFDGADSASRLRLDTRGYIGLFGQTILVARVLRDAADAPLPNYLKPILGGTANLRGFTAGTAVGDTLVAGSLELRIPLTSALSVGKMGVSAFADTGTAYGAGTRLEEQTMRWGLGGSVWFAAAFARVNAGVAHGIHGTTRAHISGSVTF